MFLLIKKIGPDVTKKLYRDEHSLYCDYWALKLCGIDVVARSCFLHEKTFKYLENNRVVMDFNSHETLNKMRQNHG